MPAAELAPPPAPAKADGPRALGAAECRALLGRVGWGVLATTEAGQPYGVPVGYALGDDCVYVATGPGRKRDNLAANPRACLTVCDVGSFTAWSSVVVEGEAEPVEGMLARATAMAAFAAQRAPRDAASVQDARRLLESRIVRLSLAGMSGRTRGR